MTTQAALKELQSFEQLLQQMAKALRCTQLQNNLPGSKQAKESAPNGTIIQHSD